MYATISGIYNLDGQRPFADFVSRHYQRAKDYHFADKWHPLHAAPRVEKSQASNARTSTVQVIFVRANYCASLLSLLHFILGAKLTMCLVEQREERQFFTLLGQVMTHLPDGIVYTVLDCLQGIANSSVDPETEVGTLPMTRYSRGGICDARPLPEDPKVDKVLIDKLIQQFGQQPDEVPVPVQQPDEVPVPVQQPDEVPVPVQQPEGYDYLGMLNRAMARQIKECMSQTLRDAADVMRTPDVDGPQRKRLRTLASYAEFDQCLSAIPTNQSEKARIKSLEQELEEMKNRAEEAEKVTKELQSGLAKLMGAK